MQLSSYLSASNVQNNETKQLQIMKRIMMTMAVAAMGMTAMMAQSHEVTTTDKNGNKVVYEISDAAATKGDTLSITTFDPQSVAKSDSINGVNKNDEDYRMSKEDVKMVLEELDIDSGWISTAVGGMILGGLICVVLPIAIIVAILLYRYFNRRKKYELAQKIVESGQPLPENFAKLFEEEVKEGDTGLFEKGVKNVGIGIAFFIFMWFLTDNLALACIGLFIIANGASQLLTYYKYKPTSKKENGTNTDNSNITETN